MLIIRPIPIPRSKRVKRCQRINSTEFRAFTAKYVAVGTGEQQPFAFVTWKFSRTLDFPLTTIVASLLGVFLFSMLSSWVHCCGVLCVVEVSLGRPLGSFYFMTVRRQENNTRSIIHSGT